MSAQLGEPPPDPEPCGTVVSLNKPVPVEAGSIPWPCGADTCAVPGTDYTLHTRPDDGCHEKVPRVRHLGEGGEGIVYLATSTAPKYGGRMLVMKFLTFPDSRRDDHVAAFLADTPSLLLDIGSSRLAKTHDVCDLRKHPNWPPIAMVMEWFPCSLQDVVNAARSWSEGLSLRLVVDWAAQIAKGLDELHRDHKRVHRDITAGNIMLKLADRKTWCGHPEDLIGAEAVITDFGTLGRLNERAQRTVFRRENDVWKHPDFYPSVPRAGDPPREPQQCDPFMDIYAYGEVLRVLDRLARGDRQ